MGTTFHSNLNMVKIPWVKFETDQTMKFWYKKYAWAVLLFIKSTKSNSKISNSKFPIVLCINYSLQHPMEFEEENVNSML